LVSGRRQHLLRGKALRIREQDLESLSDDLALALSRDFRHISLSAGYELVGDDARRRWRCTACPAASGIANCWLVMALCASLRPTLTSLAHRDALQPATHPALSLSRLQRRTWRSTALATKDLFKFDLSASKPAPGAHRAARKTSRPKGKRASNALPVDRLEALLSGNGGLTTSELATQANASRDQVLGLLRELETAGPVRRTGQQRATRWHVITDEDRIRERAAELEATRKRSA